MDIEELKTVSESHEETFNLGKRFSGLLREGDVVTLYGELGSGKTVFAKGICAGMDVRSIVTSPSYTLLREYQGRMPVFHFDFYRLESIEAIEDLDLDLYMESGGVLIIEWAERGDIFLPECRFSIKFLSFVENGRLVPQKRRLHFSGPTGRQILDFGL